MTLVSHENARIIYGIVLVFMVGAVVALIAVGHYEEGDGIPLMTALAIMSVLAGAFAKWFFQGK